MRCLIFRSLFEKHRCLADAAAIRAQVTSIHSKLDEIYQWFKLNLQGRQDFSAQASPGYPGPKAELELRFVIYAALIGTTSRRLLCPQATFRQGWQRPTSLDPEPDLFRCCCHFEPHRDVRHLTGVGMHQQLLKFACEPSSAPLSFHRQHLTLPSNPRDLFVPNRQYFIRTRVADVCGIPILQHSYISLLKGHNADQ